MVLDKIECPRLKLLETSKVDLGFLVVWLGGEWRGGGGSIGEGRGGDVRSFVYYMVTSMCGPVNNTHNPVHVLTGLAVGGSGALTWSCMKETHSSSFARRGTKLSLVTDRAGRLRRCTDRQTDRQSKTFRLQLQSDLKYLSHSVKFIEVCQFCLDAIGNHH